jgi:hypothetical protein
MDSTTTPRTKTANVSKKAATSALLGLLSLTLGACGVSSIGGGTNPPLTNPPAPAGQHSPTPTKQATPAGGSQPVNVTPTTPGGGTQPTGTTPQTKPSGGGQPTNPVPPTGNGGGTQPTPTTSSNSGCSLTVIENIAGESSSADQARTSSWSIQQANGWTTFTPGGDWHLSASSQGLDVMAPQGGADASVASWSSTTPWTYSSLGSQILGQVSDIHVICTSPNEQSSSAETQAVELTGVYQGEQIHAIVVMSILAPTASGFYDGQTRSIYTPAADWNASNEATLFLIIKRAMLNPSAP